MAAAASASVYIVICVVAALKYPATSLAIPTTRCLAAGDSPEAILRPHALHYSRRMVHSFFNCSLFDGVSECGNLGGKCGTYELTSITY
ncbi:hypothetical protein PF003_g10088 [Phytophthora fragariae]|nr:hypothetical protein PF003_g10088 [Phytophthora fragariae]